MYCSTRALSATSLHECSVWVPPHLQADGISKDSWPSAVTPAGVPGTWWSKVSTLRWSQNFVRVQLGPLIPREVLQQRRGELPGLPRGRGGEGGGRGGGEGGKGGRGGLRNWVGVQGLRVCLRLGLGWGVQRLRVCLRLRLGWGWG